MEQKEPYSSLRKVMPRGVAALFCIQTFSTLAFSVLYSSLVLYAVHGLKLSDTTATGVTASFIAFNYALHLLGGYIGGRYLSFRSLFSIGMFLQLVGCLFISIGEQNTFYWGLASFLAGAGLNVTCINCMLTQLFQPDDTRRETAFLWNYSGMNIGFFVGFSMSGYFQLSQNYSTLFILGGVGNLIALLITFFTWRSLADRATRFAGLPQNKKRLSQLIGFVSIIGLILALRWFLVHNQLSNHLIMSVGIIMALVFVYIALSQPTIEERNKIFAFIILAVLSVVFWTLYQLAPMGLTLFIERNVDRQVLGLMIAPQWVQNINTVVIIVGGPLLGLLFTSLRNRGMQLTIPFQFSIALLLIGIAFVLLPVGIFFANQAGFTHFNWIVACYVLQSLGELFISPIGYAMIGQLAPIHLQGVMMGTWMMITGVSATLSGYFSNMALGTTNSLDPLVTNTTFSHTFNLVGISSIVAGVVLFFMIPFVVRLMQDKRDTNGTMLDMNAVN